MSKVLTAVIGLFLTVSASDAASYRIDVTGAYETATVYDWIGQGSYSFATRSFDIGDAAFDWFAEAGWMRASSGSALFDGNRFSGCQGLLWGLCILPDAAGRLSSGEASVSEYMLRSAVDATRLLYSTDAPLQWTENGRTQYALGLTATGTVDDFIISQVPLPAPGLLLLGGTGLLFLRRRRRV